MLAKAGNLLLLFFLVSFAVYANKEDRQKNEILRFPENYEIRQQLKEELLEPLLDIKPETQVFPLWGKEYRVKFEKLINQDGVFYSFINESEQGFIRDSRGSYTIKRNLGDGTFQWFKTVVRSESFCYLKITPDYNRCFLDLYLFKELLYQKIVLPIDFQTLVFEPFAKIVQLTEDIINWQLVLYRGNREDYYEIKKIIERIRKLRPSIKEMDDGAQNSRGEFVYIETGALQGEKKGLNCSGFAKWVVDGFYKPLTGTYLDIEALKYKPLELRGNRWNRDKDINSDLYFGLDWTRNLALNLEQARSHELVALEDTDVRCVPFFTYRENSGYPIKNLNLLLFILASIEPGNFYLGSVNNVYSKNPLWRQHFHVAVFFPYFDNQGNFRIIVMDQHEEQSIESFTTKYSTDFIHFVRIKASSVFSPYAVE
jgi:hypothetical protein